MTFADRGVLLGVLAMTLLVTLSNILVQFPINAFLTWGAFIYPIAFLVTDLANRTLGPERARRIVFVGFLVGVVCSTLLATPRIAVASGAAFLAAQLLDIQIFNRLRRQAWWRAPFISSAIASALDTLLFFAIAFAGTPVPWFTLALGDYAVKLGLALLMLLPFRLSLAVLPARESA